MGQSLNLFNNSNSLKYLNDLYFYAKKLGLKSTYYLRNKSASKIEKSTIDSHSNNNDTSGDNLGEPTAESCDIDGTCESCQ